MSDFENTLTFDETSDVVEVEISREVDTSLLTGDPITSTLHVEPKVNHPPISRNGGVTFGGIVGI